MASGWILGAESVRMLELGHPWIIADNYTKRWPSGQAGELIELTDSQGCFLATALLDPNERIVARIISRKRVRLDYDWFVKKLTAAVSLRVEHMKSDDTNAYRLVNAEGDGLPGVTVDRYADYLMVQFYCNIWRRYQHILIDVLQKLLAPAGIYEKTRPQKTRELEAVSDSKSYGRLLVGTAVPKRLKVLENGIKFLVSLEKGLNTGLFLDQRKNRKDFMSRVAGKRVLNLFAHTGAFSVAAAFCKAKLVTSVDASAGYTAWAKDNFEINGLNHKKHEFIVGDCLKLLGELQQNRSRFDIILMDPPSFSTTAKNRFTTRGGTSEIVAAALPLLVDNGLLIASSNHQKVDIADYLKELRRGALQAGSQLRVISLAGQAEDFAYPVTFPEGRYLKYAISVKGC